jgi:glycosyltransferase involved in cell wall biosynthesis
MTPKVSVVIPTYNEEDYIRGCLDSLAHSTLAKPDFEVLVVDGMSEDGTSAIVESYPKEELDLRLIENKYRTTPFALNLGIKASISEVVLILGAHSEVYPDFLERNLQALEAELDACCVGGIAENVYSNPTAEAIGAAMGSSFGVGNAHFRTGKKSGFVDTVAFGAYRREVFERIGYFDEMLTRNQDDEFNYRMTSKGMKIFLDPGIRYKYYVRGDFKKLYRQYYQYGYWKVFVNKKHGSVTTWRQLVPMLFVAYLFIALVVSVLSSSVALLTPLILYLGLAVFMAYRSHPSDPVRTLRAFLILHLAYGIGYWGGILDALILNRSAGENQSSR